MRKIALFIVSLILFQSVDAQSTLSEGFENWPAPGWQTYNLDAALNGWRKDYNGLGHTGTGSAYSWIDNKSCDNWLVTPAITVLNGNYELKFWEISDDPEFYHKNSVLISTGSGNPADGHFVEIYEANTLNTVDWEERNISLSPYSGSTIYIAFRYESPENSWHQWNIDDVTISPSSYSDAALMNFTNPLGVSESPGTSPVIITLKNFGTTIINNFDITWSIKGVDQTVYNGSALNLQPGESTDVTIGNYNFSTEGSYPIQASVILTDDFDSSNNTIQNVYEISSFKDGAITGVKPFDMLPNAGNENVIITISNLGENTINIAEIPWAVDGLNQIPYFSNSLNLIPGETRDIDLGPYNFTSGLHYISAQFDALGDINSSNDYYGTQIAVDTFYESFEGPSFPPEGWDHNFGTRDNRNFGTPVHGDHFYVATADDNYFGVISDTLYTPVLDIKTGDHFSFYLQTSLSQPGDHKLVWKDGTTGEVNIIQAITNSAGFNQWELRDIDISVAEGHNRIGITTASTAKYASTKFDLITSDAKLYLPNKDLKILEGDMYFLAKQNVSETFTCTIRNSGQSAVLGSAYTVKLMEAPNTELASVSGVDVDSWNETEISVNHTFSTISKKRLFFKIDYADDENTTNNTFRASTVSVVPNTVVINSVGPESGYNLGTPFSTNGNTNSLGEDDISQCMYYPDEYNTAGNVYGVAYKYDNLLGAQKVTKYPLKVWIKQTGDPNLENGWIPQEELTLVFDGEVEILPGYGRDLYIPFDFPVLLNGINNIVIQNYQYSPEWPPAIFRFIGENIGAPGNGPIRNIGLLDYYELDPDNLPEDIFYANESVINTRFIIDPATDFSVLSGVITNNDTSNPIEGATVSIKGSSVNAQTDANGNYTLPQLPYGQYDVVASMTGFLDTTIQLDLNAGTQTQDFILTPLPEIEVIGSVFGNNNVSIPLEMVDVVMTEDGVEFEAVITDNNGDFIFPVVYGGSDYDVTISLYGYYIKTISITAVDANIDLGDIILEEEFISPFDVAATQDSEPVINWKSPKLSAKVKLQHDFGVESNSYTNEPNEEVWLGNYFLIDETTTITSVEFKTGKYENAIDYVTVDIFDMATFNVIASSEPFLIHKDSTYTIQVPNIVVNENVAAMIHWKDNAASTNMLTIDWSDENIFNGAVITYPKEDIYLFSDYIGAPVAMSFLMRLNTLDDGTPNTNSEAVTYNLYRGLDSDFPDVTKFNKINVVPVSDVSMVDDTAGFDPTEFYRYAVETIYANGTSDVTFSNTISGAALDVTDYEFINDEVLLFPNPAKNNITIQLGSNLQTNKPIEIYNVLGKKVITIKSSDVVNGSVTQNITSLNSGMYFMKISVNGIHINRKFIVN